MIGYWAALAATDDPNGGGRVVWPLYKAEADPFLELDNTIVAGAGVRTRNAISGTG